MSGGEENPGDAGKIKDEAQLEKLIYHAQAVSKHIREGDYVSAAFVMDNFPNGYNKSAFYAGLALGLARDIDKLAHGKEGDAGHEAQVLKQLL